MSHTQYTLSQLTSRMATALPELPHDLAGCQLLIRQLQADAQRDAEQERVGVPGPLLQLMQGGKLDQ